VASKRPSKKSGAAYRLLSGEAMHRKHPKTFSLPGREERESLPAGSYAKLMFAGPRVTERMWVRVTGKRNGRYAGVLDNAPAALRGVRLGDRVTFGPERVIDTASAGGPRVLGMKPRAAALMALGVGLIGWAGVSAWRRRSAPPA
jgi:hypothetical protein